jgi:Dr1-associated corepressor
MTDPDSSYRPRSPDFSSLQSFPNTFNNTYQPQPPHLASPLGQRASYDASPFFSEGYQPPVVHSRVPHQYAQQPFPYDDDMARRSARLSAAAQAQAHVLLPPQAQAQPQPSQQQFIFDQHVTAVAPKEMARDFEHTNDLAPQGVDLNSEQPKPWAGIDVKTKFPVARIKRIMQADEEVGKVAQVTPIAVCTCVTYLTFHPSLLLSDFILTFLSSQGARTLHDLARHQSCNRG